MPNVESTAQRLRRAQESALRAKVAARRAAAVAVDAQLEFRKLAQRARATLGKPIYPF